MDSLNLFLLIGTGLMFTGLLLGSLSARFGVPSLLIFLVVGMLAGEDGIGGIQFDDFSTAYVIGNIALAVILLDGGLRTRLSTFRLGLKPAGGAAAGRHYSLHRCGGGVQRDQGRRGDAE